MGLLAGVPQPDAESLRSNPRAARIRDQVTAADLSPDGRTLAVLTYRTCCSTRGRGQATWATGRRHAAADP